MPDDQRAVMKFTQRLKEATLPLSVWKVYAMGWGDGFAEGERVGCNGMMEAIHDASDPEHFRNHPDRK